MAKISKDADVRPYARALAAALGAAFTDPHGNDNSANIDLMLTDPAQSDPDHGVRIHVYKEHTGTIRLSMSSLEIPLAVLGSISLDKTPTISVDLSRDPAALAKDIHKRLIEPAAPGLYANRARARAYQAGKTQLADTAHELKRRHPDMIRVGEHDGRVHFWSSGAISLSGGLDSADSLRIAHGSIRGAGAIAEFLALCEKWKA